MELRQVNSVDPLPPPQDNVNAVQGNGNLRGHRVARQLNGKDAIEALVMIVCTVAYAMFYTCPKEKEMHRNCEIDKATIALVAITCITIFIGVRRLTRWLPVRFPL